MARLILFNKPFGVLSQFTDKSMADNPRETLSDYVNQPKFYPAGRLDRDSEGLLLLTDDGPLQARISHPRHKMAKTYLAQVEGTPDDRAIADMRNGLMLKDGKTLPADVKRIPEPTWIWPRVPPIRVRKSIPDTWLQITISEGKNRQVRRMTAAIGHPTLRLIRSQIGDWGLVGHDGMDDLALGEWRMITTR